MKGDFTRNTFDPDKHFLRVLMQQGRVQLDADWNEQTAILLHYLQSLAKDLIGEHGGTETGFKIETISKNGQTVLLDFLIDHGRYYVDGILVEHETLPIKIETIDSKIKVSALTINDSELKKDQYLEVYESGDISTLKIVKITSVDKDKLVLTVDPPITNNLDMARRAVTFQSQCDYPLPSNKKLEENEIYLVYLDVWERHITSVENDSIREVALGGLDTATRAKVVWQVKTTNSQPDAGKLKDVTPPNDWRTWVYENGENRWPNWKKQWQPPNRGMLKAQAKQDSKKDTDPCITSPESSYRGTENQLYRVEIHQDGKPSDTNKPTFKWSRDNGSVATGIKLNGTELTVDNPRGLSDGKWLELTNEGQELRGEPGALVKIKKIDCDVVELASAPPMPTGLSDGEAWPTKARLWESDQLTITESSGHNDKDWHKLENGVQIQFQPSTPENRYRTGDYWLIPARVATGDVEWPGAQGKPEPLPPHGVEHHYAPLAIIKVNGDGRITIDPKGDLRYQIKKSLV